MKYKIFCFSLASIICLCSCKASQTSETIEKRTLVVDEPAISSKVEIEAMTGNQQDYLSFQTEDQKYLKDYFDMWRNTIIDLSEHKVTPYNYKSDLLSESTNHMSDLFEKYKTDKSKHGCLIDFYEISYIDAKYQLDYLKSTTNITSGESSFVFDDTYDRYVYDLAQTYNIIGQTYFPDDF